MSLFMLLQARLDHFSPPFQLLLLPLFDGLLLHFLGLYTTLL